MIVGFCGRSVDGDLGGDRRRRRGTVRADMITRAR
jgi:hypothetical protein